MIFPAINDSESIYTMYIMHLILYTISYASMTSQATTIEFFLPCIVQDYMSDSLFDLFLFCLLCFQNLIKIACIIRWGERTWSKSHGKYSVDLCKFPIKLILNFSTAIQRPQCSTCISRIPQEFMRLRHDHLTIV